MNENKIDLQYIYMGQLLIGEKSDCRHRIIYSSIQYQCEVSVKCKIFE